MIAKVGCKKIHWSAEKKKIKTLQFPSLPHPFKIVYMFYNVQYISICIIHKYPDTESISLNVF